MFTNFQVAYFDHNSHVSNIFRPVVPPSGIAVSVPISVRADSVPKGMTVDPEQIMLWHPPQSWHEARRGEKCNKNREGEDEVVPSNFPRLAKIRQAR